jgi:hypothetical protein
MTRDRETPYPIRNTDIYPYEGAGPDAKANRTYPILDPRDTGPPALYTILTILRPERTRASDRQNLPTYPTPTPWRPPESAGRHFYSTASAGPAARCLPPTQPAPRRAVASEKSRRRRAYPQQIVTTRLLYCLQDPFAQLSRLQRI